MNESGKIGAKILLSTMLVFAVADAAGRDGASAVPESRSGSSGTQLIPRANTVARARAAGLPAVDPTAGVSGPFDGSEGTLYYLDRDGRVSYFHPEGVVAYFGDLAADGHVVFRYGLNVSGQYVFSADGQVKRVRVLPDEVYRWPHADAIARVLIRHAQRVLSGAGAPDAVDWAAASAASRAMHETNMAILDGMRADACTEHYDGVYYLGCW
ncbi:MAG: hypothetical protein KDI81_01060 [Xanthomonadales bacterium]|nr:hypothetical protein [Xanthomonadales bacterium]